MAKRFFRVFSAMTLTTGVMIGCCMFAGQRYIASIYTSSSESIEDWFYEVFRLYCLFMPNELTFITVMITMKTINRISLLLAFNFFILITGNALTSFVIHKSWPRADHYFLCINCFLVTLNFVTWIVIVMTDWEKSLFEESQDQDPMNDTMIESLE